MAKIKQAAKKKKKMWVQIIAPEEFNNKEIGETTVYDVNDAIGKRLSSNLSFLIGDIKKQQIKILFEITEIKENKAISKLIGYETISAYIKRLSKIAKGKVEFTLKFKTKENIPFVIKMSIFTKNRTTRNVLTSLKKQAEIIVEKTLNKREYDEIVKEIVFFQLQKKMQNELKKTIPISNVVVRNFQKLK